MTEDRYMTGADITWIKDNPLDEKFVEEQKRKNLEFMYEEQIKDDEKFFKRMIEWSEEIIKDITNDSKDL